MCTHNNTEVLREPIRTYTRAHTSQRSNTVIAHFLKHSQSSKWIYYLATTHLIGIRCSDQLHVAEAQRLCAIIEQSAAGGQKRCL